MIDALTRARIWTLIRADVAACERGHELPPWDGLPEDARVLEAWRELVAVDVSDRTRHIDEVHADLVRARARCDLALAVRDAEMREALAAPRPTLRRLQAELARLSAADLVALGEEDGPLGFSARCLTRRSE